MSIFANGYELPTKDDLTNLGNCNLLANNAGPFIPKTGNDNYHSHDSHDTWTFYPYRKIQMINGEEYLLTAETNTYFSSDHGWKNNPELDKRAVIWLIQIGSQNPQIISDSNTGNGGTIFTWKQPTGEYSLRVNTYNGNQTTQVSNVRITRLTPMEKLLQKQLNELKK